MLKEGSLRLLMESYLELAICSLLCLYSFVESKDIFLFFDSLDDWISSLISISMTIIVICFPIWACHKV